MMHAVAKEEFKVRIPLLFSQICGENSIDQNPLLFHVNVLIYEQIIITPRLASPRGNLDRRRRCGGSNMRIRR